MRQQRQWWQWQVSTPGDIMQTLLTFSPSVPWMTPIPPLASSMATMHDYLAPSPVLFFSCSHGFAHLHPLLACIVHPTHNNFITNSFFTRPTMCKPSKPWLGRPSCKTQSPSTHNHSWLNCMKTHSVASSAKSHCLSTSMLWHVSCSAVVLSWPSSSSKANTGRSLSTMTPTHSKEVFISF